MTLTKKDRRASRTAAVNDRLESTIRGYRLRAYPTERQEAILHEWQRAYAAVWNAALEQRKLYWHLGRKHLGAIEQSREMSGLRACEPLVAAAPAQVVNEALRRLDLAYQAAFRRIREGKPAGFPRFLPWREAPLIFSADARSMYSAKLDGTPSRTSGTYWVADHSDDWLRLEFSTPRGGRRLGRLGVRLHRALPDPCRVRTLALTHKAGRWHAAIGIESVVGGSPGDGEVGINRGVEVWAALSDGMLIEPDPLYPRYAAELVDLQRRISRAKKGSRRRRELVRRLNRAWEKVAARRRQRAHELANLLVSRYGVIALEDFDTKRMLEEDLPDEPAARSRHLHRRIADAAWSDLASILTYKAQEHGAQLLTVPARGITSTCSSCGADISDEAEAAVRGHREVLCNCGARHHVDVNAARNVLARAKEGLVA